MHIATICTNSRTDTRKERDTMNAYRQQQLRAAALIEQGATAEQIAEVYGWTKTHAEPEPIEQTKPKRKSKLLRILCRLLK